MIRQEAQDTHGLPIPKQQHSDKDVSNIDGPIVPSASPILSDEFVYFIRSIRSKACTNMKMLSTPTARTKNGMT